MPSLDLSARLDVRQLLANLPVPPSIQQVLAPSYPALAANPDLDATAFSRLLKHASLPTAVRLCARRLSRRQVDEVLTIEFRCAPLVALVYANKLTFTQKHLLLARLTPQLARTVALTVPLNARELAATATALRCDDVAFALVFQRLAATDRQAIMLATDWSAPRSPARLTDAFVWLLESHPHLLNMVADPRLPYEFTLAGADVATLSVRRQNAIITHALSFRPYAQKTADRTLRRLAQNPSLAPAPRSRLAHIAHTMAMSALTAVLNATESVVPADGPPHKATSPSVMVPRHPLGVPPRLCWRLLAVSENPYLTEDDAFSIMLGLSTWATELTVTDHDIAAVLMPMMLRSARTLAGRFPHHLGLVNHVDSWARLLQARQTPWRLSLPHLAPYTSEACWLAEQLAADAVLWQVAISLSENFPGSYTEFAAAVRACVHKHVGLPLNSPAVSNATSSA